MTNSILFWLILTIALIALIVWLWRRLLQWRAARRSSSRRSATSSPPAMTSQAATRNQSSIRVIRPATPPGALRVRILNRGGAVGSVTTESTPSADRPPAHARCTYCKRPFSADPAVRTAYGGEHRCTRCGSYTHGSCYTAKGKRCGGICAL